MNSFGRFAATAMMTTAAVLTFGQSLLNDPCFEQIGSLTDLNSLVNGLPGTGGMWGESGGCDIVAGPQPDGVAPIQGKGMLRFWNYAWAPSLTWQFVDVSAYSSWIDAGIAYATAGAWFNQHLNEPFRPAYSEAAVNVFYSTNPNGIWSTYSLAFGSGLFVMDNDPSTWEWLNTSGLLPVGTRWVLFELTYEVHSGIWGPGFYGYGYADCAVLEIVPEPATLAMVLPGLILLRIRKVTR